MPALLAAYRSNTLPDHLAEPEQLPQASQIRMCSMAGVFANPGHDAYASEGLRRTGRRRRIFRLGAPSRTGTLRQRKFHLASVAHLLPIQPHAGVILAIEAHGIDVLQLAAVCSRSTYLQDAALCEIHFEGL